MAQLTEKDLHLPLSNDTLAKMLDALNNPQDNLVITDLTMSGDLDVGGTLAVTGIAGFAAKATFDLEVEIDGPLNHDGTTVGLYAATPVVQATAGGVVAGFTAGSGAAVLVDSTFTGNSGTEAYTISDIVVALKNLGPLAAS